jgi:hypothetical protein
MDLEGNGLRVFYFSSDGIWVELDERLEEVLTAFRYKRYASGMNLLTNVRDLVFERR